MTGDTYISSRGEPLQRLIPDLINARELLVDLVWKDLRIRYRYALMGFLWAVIEPLALTLVLTLVFTVFLAGKAALVDPSGGRPFAVMFLCGLIFYQFFNGALSSATTSLVQNENLIKKVRFTREVIPLASLGYPLVNWCIGLVLLLGVHMLFGGRVGPATLWLLPVFLVELALTAGLALLLSAAHVRFRDVGYITAVALLFGFYASPIFYELRFVTDNPRVPQWAEALYLANPMAGLLASARAVLFEGAYPPLELMWWPTLCAAAALAAGAWFFRRATPTLADFL